MGLPRKVLYTLREASRITGVSYRTLLTEVQAGRLWSTDRPGFNGHLVRLEWLARWIDNGRT